MAGNNEFSCCFSFFPVVFLLVIKKDVLLGSGKHLFLLGWWRSLDQKSETQAENSFLDELLFGTKEGIRFFSGQAEQV